MKRDMELIRRIMKRLEGGDKIDFGIHQEDRVEYHLCLLEEAYLITADKREILSDGIIKQVCINPSLTMGGHDFLDAARDDEVWAEFLKVPRSYHEIYDVARMVHERREAAAQSRPKEFREVFDAQGFRELVSADSVGRENPAARVVLSGDLPDTWKASD